ncbi:MAG TPA: 16S rRNA (cytidine(1402)-2'-O)-methyltransferase [Pyrinomonadaceae bacterium]|nr:16S rRNA (cytidine(1402)-2'-O)-methyltransferase [Pyrinomonadaceae bacterium]
MPGTLYLVATPIGNLDDITLRAMKVLGDVNLIACEDTRHTRKLLTHFGINTRTISYHEHNERERAVELLERLKSGDSIAMVSDAGTPGISDPGFRLVQLAIENDIGVVPVPGAAAFVSALVASGIPADEFFFAGFLPSRATARRAKLKELQAVPATLILYEAPHRLAASLRDASEILGQRSAVVARELTKVHEEFARGTLGELAGRFGSENVRGEIVLVIERASAETETVPSTRSVSELVDSLEREGMDHRAALKRAARELGLTRDEAYRRLTAERHN